MSHTWYSSPLGRVSSPCPSGSPCVTWRIHMCGMTHSHTKHDSFMCVPWLNRTCDMPDSYVWHDSSIRASLFPLSVGLAQCDITHSHAGHDSFVYVPWLIHVSHDSFICVIILFHIWESLAVVRRSRPAWHDWFIHISWPIRKRNMTESYMCQDCCSICNTTVLVLQTIVCNTSSATRLLHLLLSLGVLQCVAVRCSALQCVAVRGSAWQCVAVCCSVLQWAAGCCSVLQCVAVWCSALQRVAVCCSVLQCVAVCCRKSSHLQHRLQHEQIVSNTSTACKTHRHSTHSSVS